MVKVDELLTKKRKKRDDFIEDVFDSGQQGDKLDGFDTLDGYADFDPSVALYPDLYCPVVEAMPSACMERSLLEIWGHQGEYTKETEEKIESLTQQDVINAVNSVHVSGIFLTDTNFTRYLSGVQRNSTGHIIAASGTYM